MLSTLQAMDEESKLHLHKSLNSSLSSIVIKTTVYTRIQLLAKATNLSVFDFYLIKSIYPNTSATNYFLWKATMLCHSVIRVTSLVFSAI